MKKLRISSYIDETQNILKVKMKKRGFGDQDSISDSLQVVGLLAFLQAQEMKKIEEQLGGENGK